MLGASIQLCEIELMKIALRYGRAVLTMGVLGCADPVGPENFGNCAPAVTGSWTHLGLEGQWVTALAETPWGLFAGTGEHGVYRCRPETGTWESVGLDHAITGAILFVPGPTPRLLVGVRPRDWDRSAAAVFASTDRGRTWVPWDGGLAAQHDQNQWAFSLAIDPGDPERLFMGQSISILRSTDGGRAWQYVFASADDFGNGLNTIVISPLRDGRVWAGGEGAIFNGLILLSDDWGENWEPVVFRNNAVFDLAVDPLAPARLWAGAHGGVMRSEDYGRTWEYVLTAVGTPNGGLITSVLAHGDALYAVGGTFRPSPDPLGDLALFRSGDRGTTWDTLSVPADAGGSNVAILDAAGRLLIGTSSKPKGGVWRYQP
ncbi:MAG: sialidase family protein [Gemmatimonadaceae bacterium]